MSKFTFDESLEFDNIFEVISHDPQTATDFKGLSNMFIEVRDAINQQDTEIGVNEALICLLHKLSEVFDTPRQAKEWLKSACPALGGSTPESLLISSEGRELVKHFKD